MHPTVAKIESSAWQALLARLMAADDVETASEITDEVLDIARHTKPPYDVISVNDATQMIDLAMTADVPEHKFDYYDAAHEILFMFVTRRHPSLAEAVFDRYKECREKQRKTAIVVMAAQGTEEAYGMLGEVINEYGLPKTYPRFFSELASHVEHLDKLLPGLVVYAERQIAQVMNIMNLGIEKEYVSSGVFELIKDQAIARFGELSDLVLDRQMRGVPYRMDEDYIDAVAELGPWIDVLGYLPFDETRRETMAQFELGYLRSCVLTNDIRWGRTLSDELIQHIADDPVERGGLFRILSGDHADRFPEQYLNFESFAAIDMAEWVQRDCGDGPEELTLHSVETAELGDGGEGSVHLCIWRFVVDETAYAGISGCYTDEQRNTIGPVYGSDTFSSFTEWDSQTPVDHANEALEILAEWRADWAQRT